MPGTIHSTVELTESARAFLGELSHYWTEAPERADLCLCFGLHDLGQLLQQTPQPPILLLLFSDCAVLAHLNGSGSCGQCLLHWLAITQFNRQQARETPAIDTIPLIGTLLETAHQAAPPPASTVAVLEFATAKVSRQFVYPRRNCPLCSGTALPADLPLQAHCAPLTGIVNRVEVSAAPSAGAFRAHAVWNSPLPIDRVRPLLRRQASYGRGRTASEAIDGAIGEALERYSLVYRGDESLVRAQAAELETLHPDSIQLYSAAQHAQRDRWNALPDEIFHIPEPFDSGRPVDWLPARDLHGGPTRFVPAGCCLMWYQFQPGEPRFASADTIGCGSGRTFDDALAHALLEWIERDAMSLWWYNRARRPAVRLESFDDPQLLHTAESLRAIGRRLYLLDCTTDFGIPVYVSVAPRLDGSELLFASAAHPSPRVAAWKAASEAAQVWTTAQTTGRLPDSLRPWLLEQTLATQPYLEPLGTIDAAPEPPPLTTAAQLELVLERLQAAGLRAYAVDHSRPDVLLHTARAIVPGLRHIWNRRAPGRLYSVPPRLGWLPAPLTEDDLNPICCMI
ncbi:YcaO-like family protein [Paludibaculum fermentans]|uniref:YcaO-like family protein n=1 Tax=Paludibaculum fermentans TaxID=1473598 RepID=UPI003EC049AF